VTQGGYCETPLNAQVQVMERFPLPESPLVLYGRQEGVVKRGGLSLLRFAAVGQAAKLFDIEPELLPIEP
jgi:hypothetical protein